MGLRLIQREAIEEPLQLADGDGLRRRVADGGPDESAPFEPSVMEPKAVVVPLENLELVPIAIAEHKERRPRRVLPKMEWDQGSEPVNGFPQIRHPTGEMHRPTSIP